MRQAYIFTVVMPERETRFQYLHGQNHWWARSIREMTTSTILRFVENRTVVDFGCGPGFLGVALQGHKKRYLGCDIDLSAVNFAQHIIGSRSIIFHSEATEFVYRLPRDEEYLLCLLDLWTQNNFDSSAFIAGAKNTLGSHRLIIRAPAHNHLRSKHDRWVNQTRRINPRCVKADLEREGYRFIFGTHLNLILLPIYLIVRLFPTATGLNKNHGKTINFILYSMMKLESKILKGRGLCYGLTYLMVLDYEDPDTR